MEINRPKEKNIIVGVVYRPPNSNLRDFMNSLDSLLASISKENKICYVLGDWNLDLINHHCHDTTGELLETMYSRMFFPLITRPTRTIIIINKQGQMISRMRVSIIQAK